MEMTMEGTIHIDGLFRLAVPPAMKAVADLGEPQILLVGGGPFKAMYAGRWVITALSFESTDLLGDGTPLTINFTMTIREYGEDGESLIGLMANIFSTF